MVKSTSWPTPEITGIGGNDRAGQFLVVEGPKILERAAAARQDQDVAFLPGSGRFECRHDLRGRLRALNGNGIDQHADRGKAPREHVEDVAYGCPGGRGDDADALGEGGQRPLTVGRKQTFGGQPCPQLLELALQGAEAGVLQVIDDELEFAAWLVQTDASPHQHLLAIAGGEGTQHISLPKHRAADLGGGIFQAEIPVARTRPRKIGYLRLEPQRPKAAFQEHARLPVQPRNAVHVALGTCERTWQGFHDRNDSGLPHPPPKVQCAAS